MCKGRGRFKRFYPTLKKNGAKKGKNLKNSEISSRTSRAGETWRKKNRREKEE